MSALITLAAHSASLTLGANPITEPGQWLSSGLAAYLLTLHPGTAFADLAVAVVPTLVKGQTPWAGAGRNPAVEMASQCGAGAALASCGVHDIAGDLREVGWLVLSLVLLTRLLRLGAGGAFRSPEHVVYDLGPRIVGGPIAMQLAGPLLTLAVKLTAAGALLLSTLFLSVAGIHGAGDVLRDLGAAASVALIAIPLYLTVGFLFSLIQVAEIGLMLVGLLAPILIPLALYGDQSKVATAWLRAITSCLLMLFVPTVGVAASLAVVVLINTLPVVGVTSGAVAGEAGLLGSAIASLVLAKSAFQQTRDSFRLTFESAHLGTLGALPGQALHEARRGLELGLGAGLGAARLAAGDPGGAVQLGSTALRGLRSLGAPPDPNRPPGSGDDPGPGPRPPRGGTTSPSPGVGGGESASQEAGTVGVVGGRDPLSSPGFLAYCAAEVAVESQRPGPPSEPAGSRRVEASSGAPDRHRLYAQFLAGPPAGSGSSLPAVRPAA